MLEHLIPQGLEALCGCHVWGPRPKSRLPDWDVPLLRSLLCCLPLFLCKHLCGLDHHHFPGTGWQSFVRVQFGEKWGKHVNCMLHSNILQDFSFKTFIYNWAVKLVKLASKATKVQTRVLKCQVQYKGPIGRGGTIYTRVQEKKCQVQKEQWKGGRHRRAW